jgi:ATP-dependent RNA helicase YTHDC2
VVDSGICKQMNYDSKSESTFLAMKNISQACAKQRSGRAGRVQNGFCFRLYSLEKYEAMNKFTEPEILRHSLTQICLKIKMVAGESSIENFLLKAIQPPPALNIRQSVDLLKKIEALDHSENITNLGIRLASMPVDCQLGK